MKYEKLRECVPKPKLGKSTKTTAYKDYGDFAVCIASDGKPFITDSDVAQNICHRSWCISEGYVASRVENELIRLHDYVLSTVVEEKPKGCYVDHINQDRRDNRRTNLRLVPPTDNSKNVPLRRNNKSGHIGVCLAPDKGKYRAYITIDGKQQSLGYYERIEDAVEARREAEERLGYLTRPYGYRDTIKVTLERRAKNGED